MPSDRCLSVLSVCLYVCPVCPVCKVGVLWPKGSMDQDETWHAGRPRPWPHCVRWGPSSPQRGTTPQFSAHICCGQMAGWIKRPLGREVGLGPGNIVFDADPALSQGAEPPIFGPYLLWPNGWMDQDATWFEGRPRPRPYCVTRGCSLPHKEHSPSPIFRPMYHCGKTVPHLSYC